jgi:hypothetical protein
MQVNDLQRDPVVEALREQDYLSELSDGSGRYILLCEPEQIAIAPLIEKLLLANSPLTNKLLMRSAIFNLNGRDIL